MLAGQGQQLLHAAHARAPEFLGHAPGQVQKVEWQPGQPLAQVFLIQGHRAVLEARHQQRALAIGGGAQPDLVEHRSRQCFDTLHQGLQSTVVAQAGSGFDQDRGLRRAPGNIPALMVYVDAVIELVGPARQRAQAFGLGLGVPQPGLQLRQACLGCRQGLAGLHTQGLAAGAGHHHPLLIADRGADQPRCVTGFRQGIQRQAGQVQADPQHVGYSCGPAATTGVAGGRRGT